MKNGQISLQEEEVKYKPIHGDGIKRSYKTEWLLYL